VTRQLKLLRRFLDHHPGARERAGRAYRRRLERWLDTRTLGDAEQLLILILLAEMDPEARPRLRDGIVEICRRGFSLATFPAESDQTMLFELGMEAVDWQPVAMAALDSRQVALRQRALAVVEERLGPDGIAVYHAVLESSPARGDAVIEVARGALAGHSPALAGIPAVEIFIALLRLLSEPERETLRKQAQALLAGDGPLVARLAAEPADGPGAEQVALALLNFRASDNYLFPILELLERIWGPAVVEAFRRRRERETRRITARMEDDSGELPVGLMTRDSYNALLEEIARVELELRTTIPRAIQKARELGDLRESGEYESAKLKQRQASDRLLLLQRQVAEAQVIEDLPIDDSCVQAGTEVILKPVEGGESVVYWVLGEGDSRHGPDVVSYRAELGQALWRRRAGEELELPLPGERRRFRLERIRRRLPAAAD
jgi:transcription elongation GreA/GreB family factor